MDDRHLHLYAIELDEIDLENIANVQEDFSGPQVPTDK